MGYGSKKRARGNCTPSGKDIIEKVTFEHSHQVSLICIQHTKRASLVAQLVKESTCNAGKLSSVPGLGRSPGSGKGYPLQSGLENSMDCIVHGVTKSRTRMSNFHFHFSFKMSLRRQASPLYPGLEDKEKQNKYCSSYISAHFFLRKVIAFPEAP